MIDTDRQNKKVVILGKNYSTALGVIRALGTGGYPIELFYISTRSPRLAEIAGASRYVQHMTIQAGRKDEEIIDKVIRLYGKAGETCILLPTDDYSCSLIDRYRTKLTPYFLMPYIADGKENGILSMMDKGRQIELAGQYGMKTARTWSVSLREDVHIPDDMVFPCICKPQISARGYKSEITECRNRSELEECLAKMQKRMKNRSVLVQELLVIDEEFSISGICLDQYVLIPALLRKIRIAEYEKGVTLMGQVCGFGEMGVDGDKADSFVRQLSEALKSVRYCGLVDIEVIRSHGELFFNEINFRNSGVGYAVTMAGINMPLMLADYLLNGTVPDQDPHIQAGSRFLYDKAAWEEYIFGRMEKKQLQEYINEADFTMLTCREDPAPEELFKKVMKEILFRERVKKILQVKRVKKLIRRR